jgi:hypothetical protein
MCIKVTNTYACGHEILAGTYRCEKAVTIAKNCEALVEEQVDSEALCEPCQAKKEKLEWKDGVVGEGQWNGKWWKA